MISQLSPYIKSCDCICYICSYNDYREKLVNYREKNDIKNMRRMILDYDMMLGHHKNTVCKRMDAIDIYIMINMYVNVNNPQTQYNIYFNIYKFSGNFIVNTMNSIRLLNGQKKCMLNNIAMINDDNFLIHYDKLMKYIEECIIYEFIHQIFNLLKMVNDSVLKSKVPKYINGKFILEITSYKLIKRIFGIPEIF